MVWGMRLLLLLVLTLPAQVEARGCPMVWLTGYSDRGTTSSGERPRPGYTAAASSNIALGTEVWIEGLGKRTINDRGNLSVPHNGYWTWLDLSTATEEEAYSLTGPAVACW